MGVYHIHETNITDNVYIVLGAFLYNGHFSRRDGNKVTFWLQSREDWVYSDYKGVKSWMFTYALITSPTDIIDRTHEEFAGCIHCEYDNAFVRKINGKLLNVELHLYKDKCFVTNDYREALDEVKRRILNEN